MDHMGDGALPDHRVVQAQIRVDTGGPPAARSRPASSAVPSVKSQSCQLPQGRSSSSGLQLRHEAQAPHVDAQHRHACAAPPCLARCRMVPSPPKAISRSALFRSPAVRGAWSGPAPRRAPPRSWKGRHTDRLQAQAVAECVCLRVVCHSAHGPGRDWGRGSLFSWVASLSVLLQWSGGTPSTRAFRSEDVCRGSLPVSR